MKKAILTVLMALMLVLPAYAAESGDDPIVDQANQQEQDKEPVVVATLEELQAAIDAAEYGDTIYTSSPIFVMSNLQTDKFITIKREEGFNSGSIFQLSDNGLISGFNIVDMPNSDRAIFVATTPNGVANIQNCAFIGDDNNFKSFIHNSDSNVTISDCSFIGNAWVAVECTSQSTTCFENCIFRENKNGVISNINGIIELNNCVITDNFSYSDGAIYSCGKATITNCQIRNNLRYGEKIGLDIFSNYDSELTIINEGESEGYYYQCFTGEKIEIPLIDYSDNVMLVYLTEEQAAEYFAVEPGDDDGDGEDTLPEQPQKPGDQTGDGDTTGGEQPPQEPVQPSEGEGTDNPDNGDQNGNGDDSTDTPTQTPDNPADTTPDTPQQPQEPADSDSGNYTPPTDYRPSQRPTWPVVTVKPTGDNKPQDQPNDTPASAKPQLACNGAVIDTSRTVVLLGYGDGLLHEDDPLTRAQMATIIYRLLDDDSIALYSNAQVAFADVASDAWYAPYVRVIQAAGIVNGVGDSKYDPEGLLTWGQTLTILSRFVEQRECALRYINYHGWAEQAIQTVVANGWIEDRVDFTPDAVISRRELVRLVNSVLELYRA